MTLLVLLTLGELIYSEGLKLKNFSVCCNCSLKLGKAAWVIGLLQNQ